MWKLLCIVLFMITVVTSSRPSPVSRSMGRHQSTNVYKQSPANPVGKKIRSRAVVMKIKSPHYYRPMSDQSPKYFKEISYKKPSKNILRVHKQVKYKPREHKMKYQIKEAAGFGEPPISIYENDRPQSFGEPPVDLLNTKSFSNRPKKHLHQPHNLNNVQTHGNVHHTAQFHGKPNRNPYVRHGHRNTGKILFSKEDSFDKIAAQNFPKIEATMVGGQYAEPPARFVSKNTILNNSHPTFIADAEVSASNTASSYVNYKNSNLAFSPQNLNDAFSFNERR